MTYADLQNAEHFARAAFSPVEADGRTMKLQKCFPDCEPEKSDARGAKAT